MKHTRSSSEWEIRNALVEWLRGELPAARIVHELVVSNGRADVAAILPNRLFLFEIKSERDTLLRLDRQIECFAASSHHTILVAHQKWFDTAPYDNGRPRLSWSHEHSRSVDVWCYPQPASAAGYDLYRWRLTKEMQAGLRQPHAARLLDLLWKGEALDLGRRFGVPVHDRLNLAGIVDLLAWYLTGRQISEGVCGALRRRPFAEADTAIGGSE